MAQKIESDKLLIKDVFKKWFRIPEYQRPYVWESDQVNELLDDVMQAQISNSESEYFLGSMVLKKNEKVEGQTRYIEYDLLDGQQRLTTLFLITAVVRDLTLASNTSRLNTCKESIFQMENTDDNVPERLRIVFDIRDTVRDFINDFVKQDGGTKRLNELELKINNKEEDISIRNMSRAIKIIHSFFEKHSVDDFFKYLRSNVLMIYVSSEELEDAFRLFTVMNNRGIKLRNSDILKADNLGNIHNMARRTDFAKKWEEIEKYFGEDFDNFMSHLRTIVVKKKATNSLLKEFEENIYNPKKYDRATNTYTPIPALIAKGEPTITFINKYFNHYQLLFDQTNYGQSNNLELHNYLQLMQKGFEADFWIAPLLRYFDKFNFENLLEFVKALDNKFANDWIAGFTPTDRIENVNSIIQAIDDCKTTAEVLVHVSLELNNKELTDALSGNIYGKRAARYLLLKLDLLYHGHTTPIVFPETVSIEHILPQNPNANSQWVIDFTDLQREEWTNKLGNLVLISRRKNSSQGNKDYTIKLEKYFRSNIELFSNSVRVVSNNTSWNYNDLIANHNLTFTKLKSGFGILN